MGRYDFQNDFANDAARKNYEAAMTGKRLKGLDFFEKPHLWDREKPCDLRETPCNNFVPIPTIGTGDTFAGYNPLRKIAVIAGLSIVTAFVLVCAATFFMDVGFLLR